MQLSLFFSMPLKNQSLKIIFLVISIMFFWYWSSWDTNFFYMLPPLTDFHGIFISEKYPYYCYLFLKYIFIVIFLYARIPEAPDNSYICFRICWGFIPTFDFRISIPVIIFSLQFQHIDWELFYIRTGWWNSWTGSNCSSEYVRYCQ